MSIVTIPQWNANGLLPPIDTLSPASSLRSPYQVSLLDVVMRFATSPERRLVLRGFLDYRTLLRRTGICEGFQWLDGSFVEDVETLERHAPKDIDVVTFSRTPIYFSRTPEDLALLDHDAAKLTFLVDSYFVEMDELTPEMVVAQSAYWYSMWSHRRTQVWKGFLQVDLAATSDLQAQQWLAQFDAEEVKS